MQLKLCTFRSLLLSALLISYAQLANCEIKSIVFTHEKLDNEEFHLGYGFSGAHTPDYLKNKKLKSLETITVKEGEQIKIISQIKSVSEVQSPEDPAQSSINYDFVNNEQGKVDTYAEINGVKFLVQIGHVVAGPCKIHAIITPPYRAKLYRYSNSASNNAVVNYGIANYLNTYEIAESNVSSSGKVLVLPKGTGTNELILESSEDLITWEKDVPGDKNTDSGNRFYRLRAVKK